MFGALAAIVFNFVLRDHAVVALIAAVAFALVWGWYFAPNVKTFLIGATQKLVAYSEIVKTIYEATGKIVGRGVGALDRLSDIVRFRIWGIVRLTGQKSSRKSAKVYRGRGYVSA